MDTTMNVLVVDIGGTHVKILATGHDDERQAVSGPTMSAQQMTDTVLAMAEDWAFDVVSIGYPGPVVHGKPLLEPKHLGTGWVGFDFAGAFGCPVKVVNDALLQAVGSYRGGRMLFLGLGTGLGTAMIVDNVGQPMELAHLPYKDGRTFEDFLGEAALERLGVAAWRREVASVVARLQAAMEPDEVVLGGGNVRLLDDLPPGCRRGDNANAFAGGFRLWGDGAIKL
jgi:polyphosphate glucokinase